MIDSFQGEYRFLSNFYPWGKNTVEHKYQAAKCFYDFDEETILNCETPVDAKRMGKKVKLKANWNDIKLEVMEKLVREKFKNPDIAKMLIATGDKEIQEGNTWGDTYWGICNGRGENHLGKILMKIREELKGMG